LSKAEQLVRYVALGSQPGLQVELGHWIEQNARFAAFVSANQDKIRKKFSTAADAGVRLDVRVELLVAHALLADRRFEIAFEPYGARHGGPDLSVTYRANQRFDLEITRVHSSASQVARLAGIVATKVRQLSTGVPNAVVVVGRDLDIADNALAEAMRLLKHRATESDDAFFVSRGLKNARDFAARYVRLSGIFVLDEPMSTAYAPNAEARHPLPAETVLRMLSNFQPGVR
jgi:hypothetical protein